MRGPSGGCRLEPQVQDELGGSRRVPSGKAPPRGATRKLLHRSKDRLGQVSRASAQEKPRPQRASAGVRGPEHRAEGLRTTSGATPGQHSSRAPTPGSPDNNEAEPETPPDGELQTDDMAHLRSPRRSTELIILICFPILISQSKLPH